MPIHDLIVVGASAGGVEALATLVAGLPSDLPAAVCVVVHMRPFAESHLADVIDRVAALPAVTAEHGMRLRPGAIHVAVPDHHLLVERDGDAAVLRLTRGPRENRNRPAVDPLFRSAALAFGPRVIGVVLSGALDDGTAGMWTVKDRGGIVVAQDPSDALVPSMPRSVIEEVGADHVAPAGELGPLLGRLAREAAPPAPPPQEQQDELAREVGMALVDETAHLREARYGVPSRFACPDCGGVLWDLSGDGPLRFRCETGHAYSAASLDEGQIEGIEHALWAALRAMEDKAALARRRADRATMLGHPYAAERFVAQEEAAQQHGAALRALLRLDGSARIPPAAATESAD
ncbi:CheB methylesterase [Gemmatirosa kalamazoonensis]|uniref:protein-glutamate methylesterase n=1 Tax=Gemmatirosa kalamazoonensis TaxID=861299 RepID=W0RFC3_9BACT|nr:CheB methylesterase [Gemmatirosa kalamazoonensis]